MKRRPAKQARKLVWWTNKPPGNLFRRRDAEFVRRCMERGIDAFRDVWKWRETGIL